MTIIDADVVIQDRLIRERESCEESLLRFLQKGWQYIDPAKFIPSWHLEAIAEHLQAVTDGQIQRLIINVPPRTSKPVAADSLVLCKSKGLIELVNIEPGDEVWTHKSRWRLVTGVHHQGVLPTNKLITRAGREVVAASDHPFLTPDGWAPLAEIGRADIVGVVPCRDYCGEKTISCEEARLLGYMIGDGHASGTPNITCADDLEAADIILCAQTCGLFAKEQKYRMANSGYELRRIALLGTHIESDRRRKGYRGRGSKWLDSHDLKNKNSYNKSVPVSVMRGTDEIVANFLGAYWACDGFFSKKGAKRNGDIREDWVVGCDSVNKSLLIQIQMLLLRLGINSGIRIKISSIKTKKQGDSYTSYCLTLASQDDAWRFTNLIPVHHSKIQQINLDKRRRFDFDHPIWGDEVVENTPYRETECICLSVEDDHSFTANGFAVHNSSMVSVAWPAWTWAQPNKGSLAGPQVQFLSASYAHNLSLRDSVKTRRLIQSPWYQNHWGIRFSLTSDVNTKHRFENDKGGYRIATSVDGMLTGEGGDIILVDDAHRAGQDTESEVQRKNTLSWWDEVMSTRLNSMETGAFVIVMQRLHMEDLTGHLLSKQAGFVHLMLPMQYDSLRHCVTYVNGEKFWEDPRTEEGELLCEARFNAQQVENLKRDLGSYGSAGQLQQAPAPRGGGIIKDEWWRHWTEVKYPPCEFVVGSLDTAYTEKSENDYSCLSIWGVFRSNPDNVIPIELARQGAEAIERWYLQQSSKVILLYQWQERLNFPDLCRKVMDTCTLAARPGVEVRQRFKIDRLLIEAKAAGISVAQELERQLGFSGQFGVELIGYNKGKWTPDKIARLTAVQHLWEAGIVYVPWPVDESGNESPNGYKWVEDAMDQVSVFPKGAHDDFVDTASLALRWLRDSGILTRPEEHARDVRDTLAYPQSRSGLFPAY